LLYEYSTVSTLLNWCKLMNLISSLLNNYFFCQTKEHYPHSFSKILFYFNTYSTAFLLILVEINEGSCYREF
jgi:hypothetical protein